MLALKVPKKNPGYTTDITYIRSRNNLILNENHSLILNENHQKKRINERQKPAMKQAIEPSANGL